MAINGYVSSKFVLNKLYRDLNIGTEINEAHLYEWIAEILAKIGTYYQYDEINTILELEDGKVKLPLDFYKLIFLTHNNKPLMWSSNSFVKDYACEDCQKQIPTCCETYSFYINNNYLITDVKSTSPDNKICISYLAVPVDEDGYPLVPDDVYFMEACSKYVTYMLDYREWRKGNITDKVFQKSEQDYLWYVGAAKGSANMPNLQQTENLKNVWVRLIPKQDSFNNNFRTINNAERRRRF